jgi:O-antigen ligase
MSRPARFSIPSLRLPIHFVLLCLCLALVLSVAIMNTVLGILSGLVVIRALLGERVGWARARDSAFAAVLVFCAAAVVAARLGVDPSVSFHPALKDFHKLWVIFALLVALDDNPAPYGYLVFAAGFTFVSILGVYQSFTQRFGDSWMRAHAYVHPVIYGEMLALAALGGLCFYNRKEARTDTPLARRLTLLFLLVTLVGLAFNQTRGAFLGLIAGFGAACLIHKPLRRWGAGLAAALAAVLVSWQFIPMGGRSLSRLIEHHSPKEVAETLVGGRTILWSVAWRIFKDHPWTGVGPGNYRTVFPQYFQGMIEKEAVWGSAHNLYLHQLAERGVMGLIALLALFSLLTARSYRAAKQARNPWTLWGFACMIAFLFMNISETAFQSELTSALILFIWAWTQAAARPNRM